MNSQPWTDVERDPVHARAAEWFLRLDDPQVSLEETIEWQEWMQADARHAQAFERMEALGAELQRMPRPHVESNDQEKTKQTKPSFAPLFRMKRWAMAAGIIAAVIGLTWTLLGNDALRWRLTGGETIATRVGENRSLRLADGSRVILGGDSQLHFRFSAQERRLELTRGEAYFTVARDTQRPFRVRAGTTTVTALGTEFNVRRGEQRVVVAVTEGRVMVEPTSAVNLPLAAGEQTIIVPRHRVTAEPLINPATATAWQTGQLTFRSEPLRHVLEDVNRYAVKPIVLADESLGDLKFTGTVFDDNVNGWVESLNSVFGLTAIENKERITLRAH